MKGFIHFIQINLSTSNLSLTYLHMMDKEMHNYTSMNDVILVEKLKKGQGSLLN